MNRVIVRGHLGADPVLNKTNTKGVSVCNLRLATNRKWYNDQNQLVEDTQWHNVVCWNKVAETVAQYMRKGSQVLIEGRLQTRMFMGQTTYENGQPVVDSNGQPIMVRRYTTEIVASSVEFLDKKPQTMAYPQTTTAPPFVAPAAGPVADANGVVYAAAPFTVPGPAAVVDPAAVAATFVTAPPVTAVGPAPGTVAPAVVVPVGV